MRGRIDVSIVIATTILISYVCAGGESKNRFDFGSKMIPHPEKAHRGGEDALFAGKNVLSVADGVGGWASSGVNPALFARHLCSTIGTLCETDQEKYLTNPKLLMYDSWVGNKNPGSSTLILVTLPETGNRIYTANLGDSGYLMLRRDKGKGDYYIIFGSQSQQHSFNFPYQLARKSKNYEGSSPEDADFEVLEVLEGDVVVVGSDGIFDNLGYEDVVSKVNEYLQSNNYDSNKLAAFLADEAFRLSLDSDYESPFSREAEKAGYNFLGGKSDDISVVVGKIHLAESGGNDEESTEDISLDSTVESEREEEVSL